MIEDITELAKARDNVRLSLLSSSDWRKEAREDFGFVQGDQWQENDVNNLKKQKRPCITVNRCRPMVNLITGYYAQNETEPDFLPRSEEDASISRIAKGITKYIYDRGDYQRTKKKVFRDKVICGVGYYWIYYDFNYDKLEGEIKFDRKSPFEVFVDPECIKEDLSDAEFCGLFSWEHPEQLKQIYPDKEDEINLLAHEFDREEVAADTVAGEPLWYSKELKKVRVVHYWYKERGFRDVYELPDGSIKDETEIANDIELSAMAQLGIIKKNRVPNTRIKYMTFCNNVMLEEGDSPYKHKRFPLVPDYCYYTGEKDDVDQSLEPAGIIRDLKDIQREVNKHRSQRMAIVNEQANGVKYIQGPATAKLKKDLKLYGSTPGAVIEIPAGVTVTDAVSSQLSQANIELENASNQDFYSISGITQESMSQNLSAALSGKAIDLRQRVTSVQTADIFEESKYAEMLVLDLLWGEKGRAGLIPQYITEERVMRILGEDGKKEFVHIAPAGTLQQASQVQQTVDGQGNVIQSVLYDLSLFDFDIVVTTSSASATTRQANLYQLIDAKKSGVDIPMDLILQFMDFPGKQEVVERMKQQANAPKLPDVKTSFNAAFKDLPADAQSIALQQLGINIPPETILKQKLLEKGKLPQQPIAPPINIPRMG